MKDVLWGDVQKVIDGDTFIVRITHIGKLNNNQYNNQEKIRISGFNAPEIPSVGGYRAKQFLQRKISGKNVKMTVHARDAFGRLVCDVAA